MASPVVTGDGNLFVSSLTQKSPLFCANLKTKITSDFLPLEIISAIVSLPEEGGHTGCSSAVEVREVEFQV